jgi:hypothetical protein
MDILQHKTHFKKEQRYKKKKQGHIYNKDDPDLQ